MAAIEVESIRAYARIKPSSSDDAAIDTPDGKQAIITDTRESFDFGRIL
jgi:hypothetical protein